MLGAFKDFTGSKINNWNVLCHMGFNKHGESMWVVECDCQDKTTVTRQLSSIKRSKQCKECFRRDHIEKSKKENIGLKFNRITIVDYYGRRDDIKTKTPHWVAKCECGSDKEILTTMHDAKRGSVKSCGCLASEISKKIGRKYGSKRKKFNTFEEKNDYFVGFSSNGQFIFDKEDYKKILAMERYWSINSIGYVLCVINGKEFQLHRYLMGLGHYDKEKDIIVDHINGDTLDNRKSNLRVIHRKHNAKNCSMYSNNTSGHKGISWHKKLQKWQVDIQVNKDNKYLGIYEDIDDAIEVRKNAEIKHFGEFSRDYREFALCKGGDA